MNTTSRFGAILTMLCLTLAQLHPAIGQDTLKIEPKIALDQPGDHQINLNTDSQQLVTVTYEITTYPPDMQFDLVAHFRRLVALDGPNSPDPKLLFEKVQSQTQHRAGGDVILMHITATKPMRESLTKTVAMLNRGQLESLVPITDYIIHRCLYIPAAQLLELLQNEQTPDTIMWADEQRNVVVVDCNPAAKPIFENVIAAHDVPRPQVGVTVTIIETRKGVNRNLGLYLDAWKDALPVAVAAEIIGGRNALTNNLEVQGFGAVVSALSPQALAQFINYLAEDGHAQVTYRAEINVLNAQPTEIKAVTAFPYQQLTLTSDGATVPVDTMAEEGVILTLNANIGPQSQMLNVQATANSVLSVNERGVPVVSSNETTTAIGAARGQQYALSGLKRTRAYTTRVGIPGLKHIPILKYLVSRTRHSQEDWDIAILIEVKP